MVDHQTEIIALLGLAGTLLATVIATTWKSASLTTKLVLATERYEKDREELNKKTEDLKKMPDLERRIGFLESNLSITPKLTDRVLILEQKVEFSKELRAQKPPGRGSRPDPQETEDEED